MRGVCCPFLPPEDKKGSAAVEWAEPWQAIISGMGLALLCEKRHQNDPVSQHSAPLVFLSGIVQSDPLIPVDRTLIPSPPPRPKNPVFDDEEKSKVKHTPANSVLGWGGRLGSLSAVGAPVPPRSLQAGCYLSLSLWYLLFQLLAKLLKSKNPDDLQEANKLIKSMVKEVSGPGPWGGGTRDHRARVPSPSVRPESGRRPGAWGGRMGSRSPHGRGQLRAGGGPLF